MPWFAWTLINILIAGVILVAFWLIAKYAATELKAPPVVLVFIDVGCAIVALVWFIFILTGSGGRVWVVAG